jgi:hypothetical protein
MEYSTVLQIDPTVDKVIESCYNTCLHTKEQAMNGAYFFITYEDETVKQVEFKSKAMARKAYKLYDKEPEDTARSWGWDTKGETPTLSQQIRAKKALTA